MVDADIHEKPQDSSEAPPPILGRWSRIYALVIIELAVCIVLFRFFERFFS